MYITGSITGSAWFRQVVSYVIRTPDSGGHLVQYFPKQKKSHRKCVGSRSMKNSTPSEAEDDDDDPPPPPPAAAAGVPPFMLPPLLSSSAAALALLVLPLRADPLPGVVGGCILSMAAKYVCGFLARVSRVVMKEVPLGWLGEAGRGMIMISFGILA